MTFLEELRDSKNGKTSAWVDFSNTFSQASDDLYLFVEGRDDISFYRPRVEARWKKGRIHTFSCKNKSGVLWTMDRVRSRLDRVWRALFFVDKDIDAICGAPHSSCQYLFVTDTYSIENYFVTAEVLTVIWTEYWHLLLNDPRLELILRRFSKAYETFCNAMVDVMSIVVAIRRSGGKVVLADLRCDDLIEVDCECDCSVKATFSSEVSKRSDLSRGSICSEVLDDAVRVLRSTAPKQWLRGKYELWLFVRFLRVIHDEVSFSEHGKVKQLSHVQLTERGIVKALSMRIDEPSCLGRFLDNALPRS